ncbi:hypothetical protein JI664_03650 [Rhodobacter sp. NTK016B]|uniref:hypothetical protein n=1 Tax=Rhodobacter sp. NTK016B TaxID=2759676 RepID=UPI001A8FB0F0|nr:hypothetical protein [Rhodobacter sp. NTK016B]MBN8291052.1 hypothetical protein [Rhodobacter sp. NTK016B]
MPKDTVPPGKPRRHPRTRHDARLLCALDCGKPPDLCECLSEMLSDRGMTAHGAAVSVTSDTKTEEATRSRGNLGDEGPEICGIRRAQGAQERGSAPVPAFTANAPGTPAKRLWRAIVRALTGGTKE